MNKTAIYLQLVYKRHQYDYNIDLGDFLAGCIEKLRKDGFAPQATAKALHDHIELAANWVGGWK